LLVNKLSEARPFPVDPVPDVEVAVRVDVPTVPMIDVVLELAFVDYVVDLLAHALNATVLSDLADDELVELALSERKALVDRLSAVGDDVLQLKGAELSPLLLDSS